MAESFIVELNSHQLKLVGALLHVFAEKAQKNSALAKDTIDDLASQTNLVFRSPLRHGVGMSPLSQTYSETLYPYTRDATSLGLLLLEEDKEEY